MYSPLQRTDFSGCSATLSGSGRRSLIPEGLHLRPRPSLKTYIMKIHYFFSLLLLFSLVSCLDDDDQRVIPLEASLTVNFEADFNGEPLELDGEVYDYPTGDQLKMLLFQYYVSDLVLTRPDADPVLLTEIDLIQYMNADGSNTRSRTYSIPTGDYTGIRFGLGVKPELNAMDPSEFAADFVLNEVEFWNPNARYVFAKIEANAKIGGSDQFDTGLSYHMGADDLYTTVTLPREFTVNENTEVTILADVLRALANDTAVFDIANPDQQRVHGGNQAVATGIWNRLAGQFRLTVQ